MKTLILYESKHGTVAYAAALLAEKISGETRTAKLSDGSPPSLSDFDTVILGGSIYFGKIQKTLSTFMARNKKELLEKKLGLFICGAHPSEQEREKELRDAFPDDLREHASAKDIFGYQLHFQELNRLEASVAKSILRQKEDKEGLDQERIEAFAKKISS